jgi:hypothetical protein
MGLEQDKTLPHVCVREHTTVKSRAADDYLILHSRRCRRPDTRPVAHVKKDPEIAAVAEHGGRQHYITGITANTGGTPALAPVTATCGHYPERRYRAMHKSRSTSSGCVWPRAAVCWSAYTTARTAEGIAQ